MKYKVLNPFFDKKSEKKIEAGEVLELDENRVEELSKAGIGTVLVIEAKALEEEKALAEAKALEEEKALAEAKALEEKKRGK